MINEREVVYALPWLHGKLKFDEYANLYYILGNMRLGQHDLWYKSWQHKSPDGSVRPIYSPKGELRLIQDRINKIILSEFPRHQASYGFMGGSCRQAVQPHSGFKSVLMFDLREAFSQVSHHMVFDALHRSKEHGEPYLSFYCARFVADFCTVGDITLFLDSYGPLVSFGGFLPQGAPTSPKLFDICLKGLDDKMSYWADKHYLTYTRYADNLYFSSSLEPEFPKVARCTILSEVRKQFKIHKIRQSSHGDLCHMLGLNVSAYRVSNTREFKRKFKGALYHLEYALENGLDFIAAWQMARGLAGFAVMETLPDSLRDKFVTLNEKAHLLDYGW